MNDKFESPSLGFGCASVMGKVSKSDALRAMSKAYDLGVTHFDVARSYGFGRSEAVLGNFVKGKREKVTITTKYGVQPPVLSIKTKILIPLARNLYKMIPQLKEHLKKKSGQLLSVRNFDVNYANQCLNQSLYELGTDYIDYFLIHEPIVESNFNAESLSKFMEKNINAGKIRSWGYALQKPLDYGWIRNLGGDVIQFEGNAFTLDTVLNLIESNSRKFVTRPFVGGYDYENYINLLVNRAGINNKISELGLLPSDLSLLLSCAIAGNNGTVLCSMFSLDHIEKNVNIVSKYKNNYEIKDMMNKLIQSNIN